MKRLYTTLLFLLIAWPALAADYQATDTFIASGNWTAPITGNVTVECWGSGGGGTTNVGSGGGGAYARKVVAVTATNVYAIGIGAVAADTDGGDCTFATTTVVAKGGLSGTNGGTGGSGASSTGDTTFSGGNGSIGTGTRSGGGAAGDAGAGGNASGSTAGVGGQTVGAAGGATAPNTFGGGGGSASASQQQGARGEARITYNTAASASYAYPTARAFTRDAAAGTSRTINLPSGIVANDLLFVITVCDGSDSGAGDHDISGFTRLDVESSTTIVTGAVHYKRAAGGDSATLATTSSVFCNAISWIIKDADTPNLTATNGSSANTNPPSHTPAGGNANYLWITAAGWDANNQLSITGTPTGYGNFVTVGHYSTAGVQLAALFKFASAASDDPAAFTSLSEQWVAWTIAVPYSQQAAGGSNVSYFRRRGKL